ncbi:MAG: TetR/AcrR family transcriptional regulator [Candidatus Korobacteraceae bacterium]
MTTTLSPSSDTTSATETRFDRRLSEILDFATEIFAEKGYEGASMRDLSRLSGISLAGLYYYFDSKEKLLYSIQKHTFTTILDRLRERLRAEHDPERRLRIFVHNHVEYALARHNAMKVLSHEDDVLKNSYGAELAAIKRSYYRICMGLVEDLESKGCAHPKPRRIGTRSAVMSLFGAVNWLYTWHNPESDPDAETLAQQIGDLFLRGLSGGTKSGRMGKRIALPAQKTRRSAREFSRSAHE